MSRVGKLPITIPSGVEIKLTDGWVEVKGPKGMLREKVVQGVEIQQEDNLVRVLRKGDERQNRAFHGLMRTLIYNMVTGVSTGFTKELSIIGVGYKAALIGSKDLELSLGYSHPIKMSLPEGIDVELDKKGVSIKLNSHNKELLGRVAAQIRGYRSPEPYKGKGVRYADEVVRRKAGKAAAGATQ